MASCYAITHEVQNDSLDTRPSVRPLVVANEISMTTEGEDRTVLVIETLPKLGMEKVENKNVVF